MGVAMKLDETITPDPADPNPLDAYGPSPGRHELVVASCRFTSWTSNGTADSTWVVRYYLRGVLGEVPEYDFTALVASLGLQPTGRMGDP